MQEESVFSPHWYRVAGLVPRLRPHVAVHRHRYRGSRWYVLEDRASGNHHRLNEAAYAFVGLFNGERPVQVAWELANERLGDRAPTQEQAIDILDRLHAAELLEVDVNPYFEALLQRRRRRERRERQGRFLNPLLIRLPLFDPDRLLQRLARLLAPLLGRAGLALWLLLVGSGLVLAGMHWDELSAQPLASLGEPRQLLLMLTLYPLVKLIHELAHGLLIRHWGGEVHELGVALMVLVPVPYVDGKAAGTFPDKWRRAAVAAAGVAAELAVASLALIAWLAASDGLLRDSLYWVMLIAGVSTLFFNGNPLMRFDGYYVLSDLLEIPDLWQRARRHYARLLRRLAGRPPGPPVARDRREALWLTLYGALSWAYWLTVLVGLVLLATRFSPLAGAALALWVLGTQVVLPLGRGLAGIWEEGQGVGDRLLPLLRLGLPLALLGGLAFLVPVRQYGIAQGLVQVPDEAHLVAGGDCLVRDAPVPAGRTVAAGALLLACDTAEVDARLRELEAEVRELQAYVDSHLLDERVERGLAEDRLAARRRALEALRRERRELTLRAPVAGRFVPLDGDPLVGRFFPKGTPVGYLLPDDRGGRHLLAVLEEDAVGLLPPAAGAEVRLRREGAPVVQAAGLQMLPGAVRRLPGAALAVDNGGPVAAVADGEGDYLAARPVYLLRVTLPEEAGDWPVGARADLRIAYAPMPVGRRLLRGLRQRFLGEALW